MPTPYRAPALTVARFPVLFPGILCAPDSSAARQLGARPPDRQLLGRPTGRPDVRRPDRPTGAPSPIARPSGGSTLRRADTR